MNKKRLLTVWLGEFGAEMFFWVPELKRIKLSKYRDYEWLCASYRGRKVLYNGLCDKFIPIDLCSEEKDNICTGRLNGFWLDEGKEKFGVTDVYMEELKTRKDKLMSIHYGTRIHSGLVERFQPDKVLTSNSIEINKFWDSIRSGLGVYEYIKLDKNFDDFYLPFKYVVVFPRSRAEIENQISFPEYIWDAIVDSSHRYGYKVLYTSFKMKDKTNYRLENVIDMRDLVGYTEDNSVDYQVAAVRSAEFIVGSETGALHLGIFAPAKNIVAFFQRPENFSFEWQWKLINKDNVFLHKMDYKNLDNYSIKAILENDMMKMSRGIK